MSAKKKPWKRTWQRNPSQFLPSALAKEPDRGCVLVGAAYIEYRYELLLKQKFQLTEGVDEGEIRDVFQGATSLLRSGWAKAKMARLVNLVSEEHFNVYDGIRELRNEFAHRPEAVSLDDDAVSPLLEMLKSKWIVDGVADWTKAYRWKEHGRFKKARRQFMAVCFMEDIYLTSMIARVKHYRERPVGKA